MVNPPPMTLAQPDPAGLVSGVCDESAVPSASVKVSSIRYAAPTTQPTIVLIHSQMICLHPLPEMVYMLPLGLSCLSLAAGAVPGPALCYRWVFPEHEPALLGGTEGHGAPYSDHR